MSHSGSRSHDLGYSLPFNKREEKLCRVWSGVMLTKKNGKLNENIIKNA